MSDPINIKSKDCSTQIYSANSTEKEYLLEPKNGALILQAVSALRKKFQDKEIDCLYFSRRKKDDCFPLPIEATPIQSSSYGKDSSTVSEISFSTFCLIGQAEIHVETDRNKKADVLFDIRPRFGNGVFHYLLASGCEVYLPRNLQGKNSGPNDEREESNWLLYLMWFAAFQRAYRRCSIPKAYIPVSKNLRFFRGRLNVTQRVRFFLVEAPLSKKLLFLTFPYCHAGFIVP